MELFLLASAILQNFEICEPENKTITLEPMPDVSLFNMSQDQELVLNLRK